MNLLHKIIFAVALVLSVSVCFAQKKTAKPEKKTNAKVFDFNFSYYFLEGNRCKNLGDYDGAIKFYTRALAVDNSQPAAYYEIATVLLASGDFSSALIYAEKAVQYDKTNNVAYLDLLIYAYRYNNMPEKAIPLYKKLISVNPNSMENYYELAQIYQKVGKLKDAIKVLDMSEEYLGIVDAIIVQKEIMYEKLGNKEKSFAELRKLRDAYPVNLRYKAMLAEAYFQNNENDRAANEFAELEKMQISDGLVYMSLAEYHRAVDSQYFRYFALLEKAFLCEEEPLSYELKMQMLHQLLSLAASDDYIKVQLKRLVSIVEKQNPADVALCAIKADIAIMNNDYKEVQKNLIEIVATDKSSYEMWEHLMSVDYHLNDYDNLYIHSKEAAELFPNILMAYQYYVVSAYLKEKFEEVVEAVDYASMLSIENQEVMVDMLSMQGDAYNALKNYEKADSVYEYILFKDSDYESVLNNYSYNLAVRNEKLSRALELSTRLIKLSPDNPTYIDTHAWVLYRNGKLEEALSQINRAVEKDGKSGVYYDHRGDILFSIGKVDDAVEDWKKALELNPGNEAIENKIKTKSLAK